MPANNDRFIEKAFLRNADCIVLDLEDSVPIDEKLNAQGKIKEAIQTVKLGASDVIVRVNNVSSMILEDIDSAIWPGLNGIYTPKVETGEQVQNISAFISKLEEKRDLEMGSIKIGISIETAKGLNNLNGILGSSDRIDSLTLGVEDFSLDTGIEISEDTYNAMLIPRMEILLAARDKKILPMGLMGSIANFSDNQGIEKSARLAYKHGFLGASCIHPANVEALNKGFSPSEAEVKESKNIVNAFEEGLKDGKASINYNGRMIDTPHYEKAKLILDRHEKIEEYERKKKEARELNTQMG